MSLGFRIVVETERVLDALTKLGIEVDEDKLLEAIGIRWLKWTQDNLDEAGIDGPPHQTMAPSTIAARPVRTSSRHFSSRWRSRLMQSFNWKVSGGVVDVGTEDEFAAIQHYGTDPYEIRPVSARVLRFVTAAGTVFATRVHHPGIPARPLLPTKAVAENLALEVLTAVVREEIARAGLTED